MAQLIGQARLIERRWKATMAGPTAGFTPGPANPQPFNFSSVPSGPAFDLIELLPTGAPQDRLRSLRRRRDDALLLMPPYEDIRQASVARQDAQAALSRLLAHQQDNGFNLKPGHPSVVAAQRTLDKATDAFMRLTELQATRAAQWNADGGVLAAVELWLREGRPHGTTLHNFDGPEPQLLKGERSLADAIENRRRRIRELKATKHTIESAPFLSSFCKAKMRAEIEGLAARGEPDVSLLLERGDGIIWPDQRVQSDVYSEQRSLAFAQVSDTLAIFAWLHRDALIKQLSALIDSEADDKSALSDTDRQLRTAEVEADLLATEREECGLVWRAQSEGFPVTYRTDCAAQAILAVHLVTVPRAEAPGTSGDHAYDLIRAGR
jgi:hypothetical protein